MAGLHGRRGTHAGSGSSDRARGNVVCCTGILPSSRVRITLLTARNPSCRRVCQRCRNQTEGQAESAPVHPEEIRASVDLRIGKNVALKATVRTRRAGLVTAGVMVAAIVLSITVLVRA